MSYFISFSCCLSISKLNVSSRSLNIIFVSLVFAFVSVEIGYGMDNGW